MHVTIRSCDTLQPLDMVKQGCGGIFLRLQGSLGIALAASAQLHQKTIRPQDPSLGKKKNLKSKFKVGFICITVKLKRKLQVKPT